MCRLRWTSNDQNAFSFRGGPGALPLDPAGGSAARPPLYARAPHSPWCPPQPLTPSTAISNIQYSSDSTSRFLACTPACHTVRARAKLATCLLSVTHCRLSCSTAAATGDRDTNSAKSTVLRSSLRRSLSVC